DGFRFDVLPADGVAGDGNFHGIDLPDGVGSPFQQVLARQFEKGGQVEPSSFLHLEAAEGRVETGGVEIEARMDARMAGLALADPIGPEGGFAFVPEETCDAAVVEERLSAEFFEAPVESPGVVEALFEACGEVEARAGEGSDEPRRHFRGGVLLV